jgi:uncharacterized membrane protein YfcA
MTDIILFFVGIIVGGMNAIAGGGMLFGFPVMLALGIPALTINATTNIIVLPGNVAAAWSYRKYLHKVPRSYLLLLGPAIIGAAIGATALKYVSPGSFERLIPWLIFFAVILFAFQPFLYKQLQRHLHGSKKYRQSNKPLIIVGIAMFPLSIYGGFFGAGFGFIMLAFLGFTKLHDHIHRMNALKSIITTCLALTSLFCLVGAHMIDWRHGLIMGFGNLIGGYMGATSIQKVSSHVIRIVIIMIGLATAIYLTFVSY